MRKNGGFTLLELVLVLGLLAIFAVIIVPTFLNTTERARLRGDIQSTRVIQNAMDLYRMENGQAVSGTGADMVVAISALVEAGYLNTQSLAPQTEGASWFFNAQNQIRINISASPASVRDTASGLTDAERVFIVY